MKTAKKTIVSNFCQNLRIFLWFFADVGRYHGLTENDVLVLPMDMTKTEKHQKCVDLVLRQFGKVNQFIEFNFFYFMIFFFQINVMLHNAGRSQRARWEHTDIQVDRDLFDLNVFSIISLSRLVLFTFSFHFYLDFFLLFFRLISFVIQLSMHFSPCCTLDKDHKNK